MSERLAISFLTQCSPRTVEVAYLMLARLKSLLVLDWRKRGDARARVRLAIEDTLDAGLPKAYSPALFKAKCAAVFEHLYEN